MEEKYRHEFQNSQNLSEEVYKAHFEEMFKNMTGFIERMICDIQNIIYTCDKNLLSFYANHFAKKGETVLLIYLNRSRILDKVKPSLYGDRLKTFIKHLGYVKDSSPERKGLKVIVSDTLVVK